MTLESVAKMHALKFSPVNYTSLIFLLLSVLLLKLRQTPWYWCWKLVVEQIVQNKTLALDFETCSGCRTDLVAVFNRAQMCFQSLKISCMCEIMKAQKCWKEIIQLKKGKISTHLCVLRDCNSKNVHSVMVKFCMASLYVLKLTISCFW